MPPNNQNLHLSQLLAILSFLVYLGCTITPVKIEPVFENISFDASIGIGPFQSVGDVPKGIEANAQEAAHIFLRKAEVFKSVVVLEPPSDGTPLSQAEALRAARGKNIDLVLFGTLLDYRHTSRLDPLRGMIADVSITVELAIYNSRTGAVVWKKSDSSRASRPLLTAAQPEAGREVVQKVALPGVTSSLLTGMVVSLNQSLKDEKLRQDKLPHLIAGEGQRSPEAPAVPRSDVDEVPQIKAKRRPNAYAVLFGIETYRDLPKVDFAQHDAETMRDYLVEVLGYPEEHVIVRTNERATRSDMESYFERWLQNNVDKGAEVFVYYAGHGSPDPKTGQAYLVPYDGNPSFLETTAYPLGRLYKSLDALPAGQVIVALDSCFSGAGGRSVIAKGTRPMMLTIENPVLASQKLVVLSAAQGNQISSAFPETGHGLFTYYFLKGLQGEADSNKDGRVELGELYSYLKPQVERQARRSNQEQTPQLLPAQDLLKERAKLPIVELK